MKLMRVILPVTDINRAADFYGYILEQEGIRLSPARHQFSVAGTLLICYNPDGYKDDDVTKNLLQENQFVYFATNNLNQLHERFVSMANLNGLALPKIVTTVFSERMFFARDTFLNPVCFVDEPERAVGDMV